MGHGSYGVDEAAHGQEAIRKRSESAFDLVIATIVMPERDGLEVIMFLKKEQPRVKMIALSAPGNEWFFPSARALGAARVFPRPFALADIANTVEKLPLRSQHNRCVPSVTSQ